MSRARATLIAAGAAMGLLSSAGAAQAAERYPITAQARTANAAWLAYAPAPAERGGVCLVDTGVNLTPDTSSVVTERTAVDGGSPDDLDANRHGTLMAMVAAAPANDYGMVGAWPLARISSVRAIRSDGAYGISDYTTAMRTCVRDRARTGAKVINLSLGSQDQLSQGSMEAIDDAILTAQTRGMNVVASAGNGGGSLDSPASRPLTFAVGAIDAPGAFCSFSARGTGLDISAPGCGLNVAIPDTGASATANGTSEAAAFTSAVIAALRSYAPELTVETSEQLLEQTARTTSAGKVLDVEAAFRAQGLGSVVDAGTANLPASEPAPTPGAPTPTAPAAQPGPAAPAPTPSPAAVVPGGPALTFAPISEPDEDELGEGRMDPVRVKSKRYRRGILELRLSGRERGAIVRTQIYAPKRGKTRRIKTFRRRSARIRMRVPRLWSYVRLTVEDQYGDRRDSKVARLSRPQAYASWR